MKKNYSEQANLWTSITVNSLIMNYCYSKQNKLLIKIQIKTVQLWISIIVNYGL